MSKLKHFKNIFNPNLTEEELDRDMFKNTKYAGMSFTRQGDWTNFDQTYSTPVFIFENGDHVVFDRYGELVVL